MKSFDVTYHATQKFRQRFPQYFMFDPRRIINDARLATESEWVDLEIQSINHTARPRNQSAPKTLYYLWKDVVFVGHEQLNRIVIQSCWQKITKPTPDMNSFMKYIQSVRSTPTNFSADTALTLLPNGFFENIKLKIRKEFKGIKYEKFIKHWNDFVNNEYKIPVEISPVRKKNDELSAILLKQSFKDEMERIKMQTLNTSTIKSRRIKYMVWHNGVKKEAYIEPKLNPKEAECTGWIKVNDRLVRGKILQDSDLKLYFVPNH